MTDNTNLQENPELLAKLRMGAARQSGVVNTNARLRYLASDFPGIVFESEQGNLRFSAGIDQTNFDNEGRISYVSIVPHKPSGGWCAEIGVYHIDDHAERTGQLGSFGNSEVSDTPEQAREWLHDQGFDIEEYPTETLEKYRHPDECDTVSIDLVDGDTSFTCYVIDERDGELILSRPQTPQTASYALTVETSPVTLVSLTDESPDIDPWSPNHDPTADYQIRKYWRHSFDD